MADDTWGKIQDRITELTDLNARQDATADFLNWDDSPYELVKPDGTTKLRDAISVTPNHPKVFAHGVISDLLSGQWQTVVEGDISKTREHDIEQFVDDNIAQANEYLLAEYGIPSLDSWLSNHVCVRWAIGVKWIAQVIDGEYKIDCLPVDMRWTPFVRGKWVAPITFLGKSDLEEELEKYKELAGKGIGTYTDVTIGTDNEVRDYWENDTNELWVNSKIAYKRENPLGYPPFVIVVPASGFMLRDKGYLKYEGMDILFLNAGLYKELARSLSLEQTSGYAGLYPAFERPVKNYDSSKPSMPMPELDESLDVPEGELHQPIPRGDLNNAGQTARADIQGMISSGAPLAPREYNTPPSAVLLAGETELIAKLQNSRKDALGIFRSQLARMMIKQFVALKQGDILIGKQGVRKSYSVSKLGDPEKYNITYRLSVKSKRQELANLAEFAAVYDKLPLEWTLPNILMADDPAGIINALELQKAKQINPALSLLEMSLQYARKAKDSEDEVEADLLKLQSKILLHDYVMMMRQRAQPQLPLETEEPKGSGKLMNDMGGAAGALRGDSVKPPQEAVR